MKVTVSAIRVPDPTARSAVFDVVVILEVEGRTQPHVLTVDTVFLADVDTDLVQASPELDELFRHDQRSLHQIMQLVGRAVRQGHVQLPQLVAA